MSKNQNVVPTGTGHGAESCLKIIGPETQHARSREPVTRSRMTVRGRFPSAKMGRMVDWESQLERRACYRFEFSSAVRAFREQPSPIRLQLEDSFSKYTPDFELEMSDGSFWIAEIKPLAHLYEVEWQARFIAASEHYKAQGYQFVVITDHELIEPALEANLTLLRKYQSYPVSKALSEQAKHWCDDATAPTFTGLSSYLGSVAPVYALLSASVLTLDLSQPISPDSHLYITQEGRHATCLFSYRTAPDFGLD